MLRGRIVTRLLGHVNWKRSGWVITVSSRHGGEKLVLWYGEDERLNVTGRKSNGWTKGVERGVRQILVTDEGWTCVRLCDKYTCMCKRMKKRI